METLPHKLGDIRISRGYRAVGTLENDTVTWFWVGGRKEYEKFFG